MNYNRLLIVASSSSLVYVLLLWNFSNDFFFLRWFNFRLAFQADIYSPLELNWFLSYFYLSFSFFLVIKRHLVITSNERPHIWCEKIWNRKKKNAFGLSCSHIRSQILSEIWREKITEFFYIFFRFFSCVRSVSISEYKQLEMIWWKCRFILLSSSKIVNTRENFESKHENMFITVKMWTILSTIYSFFLTMNEW